MSKNRPPKKEKAKNEEPGFEKLVVDDFEYQTLYTKNTPGIKNINHLIPGS